MEENKLSTNLEQINASVSDIRNTLGAEDVSIDELSTRVGEVKTNLDELANNMVYQVNTREEMYALDNVSEGSTCLVKGQEIRPSRVEDKFTMIYFPETVTLPIGFPDESFSLYIADTGHGAVSGTLSGPYFDFTMIIKGQGSYGKNIKYVATTEGNKYVYHRQDTFGSPVQSAGELSYQTFGPCASEFFRILDEVEETYIYREGGWAQYSLDEVNELNFMIEEQNQMINELDAEIDVLNTTVGEQEITIQDLREQLNNIPTGGSGDVLLASTVEEMNTLEAEEGQLCLVYEDLSESIDWTAETLSYTIPEKIVVPSNLTRISATVKSSDSSTLMFSVNYASNRWSGMIRYTDANGTITQTSVSKVVIDGSMMAVYFATAQLVGTTITLTSSTITDAYNILPFIGKTGSGQFGGIYQKTGTTWRPVDSGLTATSADVLTGQYYSGYSIKEGNLLSDNSTAALAKKLQVVNSIHFDTELTFQEVKTLVSVVQNGEACLNALQFARIIGVKGSPGDMLRNFGVDSTFEIPRDFIYDLSTWDVSSSTTLAYIFENFLQGNESARNNFKKLDLSSWKISASINTMIGAFKGANAGKEIDCSSWIGHSTNGAYLKEFCANNTMLEKMDLRSITTLSTVSSGSLSQAFYNCTSLKHLDIRSMEITSSNLGGQSTFDGVPVDCLIIVKDDNVRNIIKSEYPNFTNIKTIAEYKAD